MAIGSSWESSTKTTVKGVFKKRRGRKRLRIDPEPSIEATSVAPTHSMTKKAIRKTRTRLENGGSNRNGSGANTSSSRVGQPIPPNIIMGARRRGRPRKSITANARITPRPLNQLVLARSSLAAKVAAAAAAASATTSKTTITTSSTCTTIASSGDMISARNPGSSATPPSPIEQDNPSTAATTLSSSSASNNGLISIISSISSSIKLSLSMGLLNKPE